MTYKDIAIDMRNNRIKPLKVSKPLEWKTPQKGMIERMLENIITKNLNK